MSYLQSLMEQLQHENPRVRAEAAKQLGNTGIEAIDALTNTLQDEHIIVARTAALSLGKIGGCDVVEPLAALLEHNNLWLRKAAVQALGMAQCGDAAPLLVNALADKDLHLLAREALIALKVNPDFF